MKTTQSPSNAAPARGSDVARLCSAYEAIQSRIAASKAELASLLARRQQLHSAGFSSSTVDMDRLNSRVIGLYDENERLKEQLNDLSRRIAPLTNRRGELLYHPQVVEMEAARL